MGSFYTKEVNCRCGATLQWSDLRKAWYCIECPFNTFPKSAESFSADEQKACHRCGNTEKDGKLWWVGSRKGFICGSCSSGGKKYRAESGCANCDKQSHFTYEDLPVGPRSFCSEKCWAEYVGMPTHPEGYYGFVGKDLSLSAESTNSQSSEELQKIQKELALERTELSRLSSEFSAKRTAMSGIRTILAIGTFILVLATFKHQKDTNS
jgi:hypothetical protein